MNKQERINKSNRTLNIILCILLLLSVIWWVIDEEKDNIREKTLTNIIVEYQCYIEGDCEGSSYQGLLPTIAQLNSEVRACRNGN